MQNSVGFFGKVHTSIPLSACTIKVHWGHLVIGSSVHLAVCLSVHNALPPTPTYINSAIIKAWVGDAITNMDCKFILGLLTFHWHHMPLGWGRVRMKDLKILSDFGFASQTHLVVHHCKPCLGVHSSHLPLASFLTIYLKKRACLNYPMAVHS